jgi:hypothetical protein
VGAALKWQLAMRPTVIKSTGQSLQYDFVLQHNGTIESMVNKSDGGSIVSPLRQWRRVAPFH